MTTQTQLTLDRVLRIVISIGLVLSVLGTPAFVPLVQAKTSVDQPLNEPKPEGTPVVEETPTPEPTPEATLPSLEAAQVVTTTIDVTPIPPSEAAPQLPQQAQPPMQSLGKVAAEGGRVQSGDGRAQLEFPTGAVAGEAEVKYGLKHTRPYQDDGVSGSLIEFELEAVKTGKAAQAERVSHFEKSLTLTIDLTGLLDLKQIPEGYYVYLYTVTPEGYQNPVWPITIDGQAGTISAQVDHFSGWGAGLAPGTPGVWEFNYTAPEVALYSGAATAQIPLQVPAGRNGLQPNLSLSYNSATLNGLSGAVRGTRDWTRGGELGGFWGLDGTAKIAREKWDSCRWGDASNWRYTSCFKDVFTLILGGTGYTLVPAAGDQIYGRYYAEGGPDLYIYRYNNCSAHSTGTGRCTTSNPSGNPSTSNETGEWWLVRTADGTAIEFGKTIDAEQVAGNICNPLNDAMNCKKPFDGGGNYGMGYRGSYAGASNGNPSKAARAWWANKFTDQFNNTMEVSYYTYWYDNGERVTPKEIKYNSAAGGSYLSRVKFEGHAEIVNGINPPDNEPTIDRVEMYTKDSGGVEQLVHKYLFTRTFYNRTKWVGACNEMYPNPEDRQPGVNCGNIPSYFEVLNSVQEVSGSGASLPVQTFGYEWRNTRDWNDIMQLTSVNNGYGAVTTFGYAVVTGSFCSFAGCNDYAVSNRGVSAGAGTPDMYATYDYGQVCYDAYNPGGPTECASRATILCGLDCDFDRFVKLSGFGVVTATQWAGTTAAARSKHYFKNANPAWIKGREYKTEQLDPANNNALLTSQVTTWSDKWYGAWFAFAGDQTATTYNGGQAASTRTSYTVNEYNNVVSEYQYGAGLRMLNAGFENALTHWNHYYPTGGAPVATSSTDTSFAGNYSLKLSGTGNTGGVYQDVGGLLPNVNYTARVRVKWSNPSASGTFRLWLHDTTTNGNNGRTSNLINPGNDGWSVVTVSYPANATGAVRLHMDYEVVSNGAIYVDEVELARTTDIGDERSVQRVYGHNPATTEWIIGKLTRESTYAGIRFDDNAEPYLQARTRYRYDYACPFTLSPAPTSGLLTAVDQWNGLRGTSDNCTQTPINAAFQSSYTTYDAWGNPLTMKDARGNTTSATYDNDYHLYPLQVTNAKSQSSQYQFYGINGVATDNTPIGSLKKTIDPNNAETLYTYDGLGRLLKVVRPYDNVTYPTTEYRYDLGGDVHAIQTYQREASGVGSTTDPTVGTLWSVNWIDGLGRIYQSRTEAGDGSIRVQDTFYDALGRTITQSVPYAVTTNGRYATPADLSQPRTTTAYDTLGRVTTVTAPDGTTTTHGYYIDTSSSQGFIPTYQLNHTVADANSHAKQYIQNAYGQLAIVREMSGTVARTLYAETKYTYDVLDNLTQVRDALGNTTVMTYNTFSQKTGMLDPDMGAWSYQYDAAGNLTVQDDAKHQRLCFFYDELNRLIGKSATTDQAACPAATTTYGYDAYNGTTQFGRGHRTSMTDQSGSANWVYDLRGRVTQESKTINGATGAFNTSYTYDAMDRAQTITYPTGEVVNQTYNAASQLTQVRSQTQGVNYATGLTYNALGQPTQMTYGNGTLLRFGYWGLGGQWDQRPGSGLLNFGRLYRTRAQSNTGLPLYDNRYSYDKVGNVTRLQEATRSASNWPSPYILQDSMDALSGNWTWSGHQTIDSGTVKNTGTGSNYTANFYRNAYSLSNAYGAQVRFKVDRADTISVYAIETSDGKRFGAVADGGVLYAQYNDGSGFVNAGNLISSVQLNTWYVLRINIDTVGGFYVEVYQENNPTVRGSYTRVMPSGLSWRFHHWIYRGNAWLDDYREYQVITFDTKNTTSWTWNSYQTVPYLDNGNNVVKSTGTNANYDANFYRNVYYLTSGKGLQLRFKVDATNTSTVMAIESSDGNRFGVIADGGKLYVQYNDGSGWRHPVDLLPSLATNTWYVLRIVADDTGRGFYVEAYQESNPTIRGSYNQWMPTGKSWRFHHWVYRGNAYLDDYREFDASGLSWTSDERMTFSYDALDRLQVAQPAAETGAQGYTQSFTYDPIGNIQSNSRSGNYWYSSNVQNCTAGTRALKPHAVTDVELGGGLIIYGSYAYDCNGNMTQRIENNVTYSQTWTKENRVETVSGNGQSATYTYDGDGNRVKKVQNGVTTIYLGAMYEKNINTGEVTTYYFAGSQRVAMRKGGVLTYFVADHLGSTSLALDASGNEVANSRQKYYPFGETRNGNIGTDRRFTGQRAETGLGSLYDYNARMYSPVLGRFISPDTVVPDTKNPQAWNRYAYVVNNPLKYNDPSGHCFLVCGLIGAAVGLVGYTAGAIINQSGWNVGDAALTSGTGFVVGATLGTAAPLVMGAGAEVLASAGAATGSTTLAAAATTTWAAGTSLAAVDGIALKMVADRLSQIRQMNFAPSSPVPSVPGLGTSSSGDSTALTNYWPSNRGFYGETTRTHLMPGEVVDRYGYEGGTFVSPQGTAFETRALPSESLTKPFHTYQVMKPIEAVSGVTTPAFGQIGFGTAYELPRPISILLKRGFLQEIIP